MTQFLLKLLGTPAEDALAVSNASFAFRGGVGYPLVILAAVVLGLFTWWSYIKTPVAVTRGRKWTLTILRLVFFAMVLGLLMRPILALTVEGSIRRSLVFLVDDTSSMQIRDPRLDNNDQKRAAIAKNFIDPTKGLNQNLDRARAKELELVPRIDLVKSALKNPKLDLLPRLDRDFDLDPYTFGQGVAQLAKPAGAATNENEKSTARRLEDFTWVDKLAPSNPITPIGDSLREVINRKRGQPLAGVVLITDGANNSGTQPREVAALLREERVPLYIYGVGITSPRDIIVGNIFAPDVSFVKDEVPVTVRVRSQGLSGQTARVKLQLGGTTVAEKEISFGADGEQVVPLRFTPQNQGEFELTASIDARDDETVKDNNSRSQQLKIIDAKIKVLLVDQSPRWEFRYLQAMLMRDRRVELKCFLVEQDAAVARGTNTPFIERFPQNKEDLYKYDVVMFGDVDPRKLPSSATDNLSALVSQFGGSVVFIAGRKFMPNAYRRTVVERMLPVDPDTGAFETMAEVVAEKPVRLELTSAGRANAMMRLSDREEESVALWKQLPPVYWVAKVARPKPAAEVLLVDPDPARETRFGKMPVVALQQYGIGQTLYVGTDNTWRWRKNVGDLYYTTLWGQIAQRMSIQRLMGGSKRTQLTTDRQNYMSGERVTIYARLYTPTYEPMQEQSVKGVYGVKSGGKQTEVVLRAIPEQPGLFRGEFVAQSPGQYQFFVTEDLNTPLDFNVSEPRFELGETAMNEGMLREIANVTGGAFFREEDLYKLPETISAKTERVRSPLEVELWSSPLYFLLMLFVLSGEWVLRKWSHLK
ncbi:MAG TPA: vWA domain-containing protein [Candidatus Acidoferrum sp.]|nr:vWA domain-containing protein [Candidatus Acidoferrum sp.]